MSLFFVSIGHIGDMNPTTLVKKNMCVKILPYANIQARKAAIVRNYFSRHNICCLNTSQLPYLSLFVIFNQIKTGIPSFNMNDHEWGLKMQSEMY